MRESIRHPYVPASFVVVLTWLLWPFALAIAAGYLAGKACRP